MADQEISLVSLIYIVPKKKGNEKEKQIVTIILRLLARETSQT